ncbi:MAG: hypothetical protein ABII88_02220 [Candidatus Omnitrophota bacterium]
MFKKNELVMHPRYGLCSIADFFSNKYILRPRAKTIGSLKIFVDREKVDLNGIRYPVSKKGITRILKILGSSPRDISREAKHGYAGIKEIMGEGQAFKVAEVVRDLRFFKGEGNFSARMKAELLESGIGILVSEISHVKAITQQEAVELVDKALTHSLPHAK